MRTNHPEFSLTRCRLCPRECGVDRTLGQAGLCGSEGNFIEKSTDTKGYCGAGCLMEVSPGTKGYCGAGCLMEVSPGTKGYCGAGCLMEVSPGTKGYCGAGYFIEVSRIMLHHWEEPCISGNAGEKDPRGSGAVFFTHCSLGCVYCQNRDISRRESDKGRTMTPDGLADAFLRLQETGAYNVNLVSPTHYAAQIADALERAKSRGLTLPVVWNTGGYENADVITALTGLVDVYLTDFKYADPALAAQLSCAADYPEKAAAALDAMYRSVGPVVFDENGMIRRGVILRHLCLPGCRKDSMAVLRLAAEIVPVPEVRLSLMRQYTPAFLAEHPVEGVPKSLLRRVTEFEYQSVLEEAIRLGFDGYTQEKDSAVRAFTPDFAGAWEI